MKKIFCILVVSAVILSAGCSSVQASLSAAVQATTNPTASLDTSTIGTTEPSASQKPAKNKEKQKKATQSPASMDSPQMTGGVILSAPTDTGITVKAAAMQDMEAYVAYGPSGSSLSSETAETGYKSGEAISITLSGLKPDTGYSYRFMSRTSPDAAFAETQSGSFHTQRAIGESFTFCIQADSHLDENSQPEVYTNTLRNIRADKPDFLIDLGDTFMGEKLGVSQQGAEQRYREARGWFESIGMDVPLLLVNGNHEGENGWMTDKGMPKWASGFRFKYFPNPESGNFYSGSAQGDGNYYAFTWGDALFVTLDPFWFTTRKAKDDTDGWEYTLGKAQYDWLKNTLQTSKAKYKFIFIHNLVGGFGKDARGGADEAKYFEWGGSNADGSFGFDQMRPGWGAPIHELLVQNHVTAVFHGHDHFYAKQELDGIIYQLVPQPIRNEGEVKNAMEYGYVDGVFLPSGGHLRLTISMADVKVEYVSATNGNDNGKNFSDSYILYPR